MDEPQEDTLTSPTNLKARQIAFLSFPKTKVRCSAVHILSTLYPRDADIHQKIAELASDPSAKVRKFVVTALGRMQQPESLLYLQAMVRNPDEDEHVRWQAAAVIGAFPPSNDTRETITELASRPRSLDAYLASAIARSKPTYYSDIIESSITTGRYHALGITKESFQPKHLTIKHRLPVDASGRDRVLGSIWGSAIGDAMGAPIEFYTLSQIKERFGTVNSYVKRKEKSRLGRTSDDTAGMLNTLYCLAHDGGFDPNVYAYMMGNLILDVDRGISNPGFGPNTIRAGRLLYAGMDWHKMPYTYDTCGGAIRVSPIGALLANDEGKRNAFAASSSKVTHNTPDAVAGAVVAAAAVAYAVRMDSGFSSTDFIEYCAATCSDFNPAFGAKVRSIKDHLTSPTEIGMKILGTKNKAIDVVPAAMYAFLSSPGDFRQAVVNAINVDGDSDSIGAIAGAIAGAYHGQSRLPHDLISGLYDSTKIQKAIGDSLACFVQLSLESICRGGSIRKLAEWQGREVTYQELQDHPQDGIMYNSLVSQWLHDLLQKEFKAIPNGMGASNALHQVIEERYLTLGESTITITDCTDLSSDEKSMKQGTLAILIPETPECQGVIDRLFALKEYIEGAAIETQPKMVW